MASEPTFSDSDCETTADSWDGKSNLKKAELHLDSDEYRKTIELMKYTRWWDDLEDDYKGFEKRFCEDIKFNMKSIRAKHFTMTKLIRHYEIDMIIESFINSCSKSGRDMGVYIGYTSPGAFSRMFDETVKSPDRKNGGQRNLSTIRRFILDIELVPSEVRADFTEKSLVKQYFEHDRFATVLLNCPTAATIDRQDGWVYITLHAAAIKIGSSVNAASVDETQPATATTGEASMCRKESAVVPRSLKAGRDERLYLPEVNRSFVKINDCYQCCVCGRPYRPTRAGLSVPARKHYLTVHAQAHES